MAVTCTVPVAPTPNLAAAISTDKMRKRIKKYLGGCVSLRGAPLDQKQFARTPLSELSPVGPAAFTSFIRKIG